MEAHPLSPEAVERLRRERDEAEAVLHDLLLDRHAGDERIRADERARAAGALLGVSVMDDWSDDERNALGYAIDAVERLGPAEPLPAARLRRDNERLRAALRKCVAWFREAGYSDEHAPNKHARGALEGGGDA